MGITINEILIPKTVFSAKVDKDLEFDTSIPDHCPDIARIIKVDCTPFTEKCIFDDGKAIVSGKVVYDILYETDYKNRLRCCSFTQEFNHALPIPRNNAENIAPFCSVECERIDCKLLGARRMIIRTLLSASFDIEGDISVKAVAVEEDGSTFFRKKTVGFDGRTSVYEETFRFSDELPLNRNEKSIGEIVCGNITLQPAQTVITPGHAEIKTSATAHILCEEENNEGSYYMAVKTLPVNIDFDNEAIEDFKRVDVSLEPADPAFRPELDQYGENRVIKSDFEVKMSLKVNEPKAYTLAEDVFEKGYDSMPVVSSVAIPHTATPTVLGFTAEGRTDIHEPAITALLDSSARNYSSQAEKTEGGVNLSGSFTATFLVNTPEGIHSFDHNVPYEQFLPYEHTESDDISAEVQVIEVISTLHSDGSIGTRIIAEAKLSSRSEESIGFISELSKRTPAKNAADGSALVYCYPQRDENLWDIAKYYRADPSDISKANPDRFDESGNIIKREPIKIKC